MVILVVIWLSSYQTGYVSISCVDVTCSEKIDHLLNYNLVMDTKVKIGLGAAIELET